MSQPPLKKSLGQHFLINQDICRRIAALLQLTPEDNILEIGPGAGALTRFLVPHKRLLLIEKDDFWAKEHAGAHETLNLDALRYDWRNLDGRWKLAGNLPYNIASPLIWNIVSECAAYALAAFMVQREVGERICARPGSAAYGALSVWVQSHAAPRLEFLVKPGSFQPPPKVDSAVITLRPLDEKPRQPAYLKKILDLCFQARRKQLGNIFRGRENLLRTLALRGLKETLRPENLTCADFMALSEALQKPSPRTN